MSRLHGAVALLILASLGGCGESRTVTVIAPRPAVPQATATTATTTPTVAQAVQPNPVVHFTLTTTSPEGTWPFTAQLASIGENPNGVTGSDPIPPQDTYLIVRVNVTSQITGRTAPSPRPHIVCHGPNDQHWQLAPYGGIGYDRGSESAPDTEGVSIAPGDGQPHSWDTEWQVPEGTSTTGVKCVLKSTSERNYIIRVVGSRRLN